MVDQTKVLIVGAGAIGSFYGAILHRAGAAVSVVLRSEYEAVRDNGFKISSPLGDLSFRPAAVYRSTEEVTETPDYLVVALKVVEGIDRVRIMRPAVGPNTTIVLIENGIDIEPEIVEAFPNNTVVSALAFVAVSRVGPGLVDHKAYGQLMFGDFPKGASAATHRFAELLQAGGIKAVVSENVLTERWRKAVWNTPFNPTSVLAGGADTKLMLSTPENEALIRAMMQEVCAVAAAAGHPLPEDIIDSNIDATKKMPAYHNSMALDFLNGRPLEVEPILGNVVRMAEKLGVPVPHLSTAYGLLCMLVANLKQRAQQA